MKIAVVFLVFSVFFQGCAQERFYHRGQLVASFQGDMRNTTFLMKDDGTIYWTAESVDNSTASTAQKKGLAAIITNIGAAIAASGIPSLFR